MSWLAGTKTMPNQSECLLPFASPHADQYSFLHHRQTDMQHTLSYANCLTWVVAAVMQLLTVNVVHDKTLPMDMRIALV